ncbi:MAG: GTPase Era [Anaerolineae bacterium]
MTEAESRAAPGTPSAAPDDAPADKLRSGFVAVVGRPNVGKSTLVNAYAGEKVAIVSPRPQTTRRRILGIRTTEAEQAIFVDTPGVHKPRTDLGKYMVGVARRAVPDADVVVWVVDVSRPPGDADRAIAGWIRQAGRPTVIAMNKSDLLAPENIAAHTAAFTALAPGADWALTIATEDHNLDLLWDLIRSSLPEGPMFYPPEQVTDQTDRMLVSELVREAALRFLEQEVPHGVETLIEEWETREDGVLQIGATLIVERESHKGIVIGKGGAMIKQIGRSARAEIERLLERHVYLDLRVKARPGWRKRGADVRRFGYD